MDDEGNYDETSVAGRLYRIADEANARGDGRWLRPGYETPLVIRESPGWGHTEIRENPHPRIVPSSVIRESPPETSLRVRFAIMIAVIALLMIALLVYGAMGFR